jgi:hypothetical protein
VTYITTLLLHLISISVKLAPLLFESVDFLFQLVQRTGHGLEFTIQSLQRLPLINSEDIGVGFPGTELGGIGMSSIELTVSDILRGSLR